MTTTELYHKLANEGNKIHRMRYTKTRYRFMDAKRLYILVKLEEIKLLFNKTCVSNGRK